jgi:hypothetical protein
MAKYDLYLRADDPEGGYDALRFCLNFFKGVGFGLWLQLCLVTGLAVALSTYLSSIITLLTTSLLYVLGFFQDFIQEVAFRKNVSGPLEGALRLVERPGGSPGALDLPQTTVVQVSTALDQVFGWLLRLVLNIIPDVDRFSFTDYVAEGVAVSSGQMLMSFLLLVGYLLPWAVFAFYLLKWREVASST